MVFLLISLTRLLLHMASDNWGAVPKLAEAEKKGEKFRKVKM